MYRHCGHIFVNIQQAVGDLPCMSCKRTLRGESEHLHVLWCGLAASVCRMLALQYCNCWTCDVSYSKHVLFSSCSTGSGRRYGVWRVHMIRHILTLIHYVQVWDNSFTFIKAYVPTALTKSWKCEMRWRLIFASLLMVMILHVPGMATSQASTGRCSSSTSQGDGRDAPAVRRVRACPFPATVH